MFAENMLECITVIFIFNIGYCSERKQCVTGSGAAAWKIIFGEGVQLNVEASEYVINLKSCYDLLAFFLAQIT